MDWCSERGVDPLNTTAPILADFLNHLFTVKELAATTIAGYRSAISSTLKELGCPDLGSDVHISKMLSNMYAERPRASIPLPQWNLALVLSRLLRAPFEPLQSADLRSLTWKTTFLLSLASAKRRSEMHAFTKSVRFPEDWHSVTLKVSAKFLAKNHVPSRPDTALRPVTIPALTPHVGTSDLPDAKLCPVRAIKCYLARTASLRGDRTALLISHKPGKTSNIAPATVSSWMRKLIKFCYEDANVAEASLIHARPHDLQAQATSWNMHRNASLSDIMAAAQWRAHNIYVHRVLPARHD